MKHIRTLGQGQTWKLPQGTRGYLFSVGAPYDIDWRISRPQPVDIRRFQPTSRSGRQSIRTAVGAFTVAIFANQLGCEAIVKMRLSE